MLLILCDEWKAQRIFTYAFQSWRPFSAGPVCLYIQSLILQNTCRSSYVYKKCKNVHVVNAAGQIRLWEMLADMSGCEKRCMRKLAQWKNKQKSLVSQSTQCLTPPIILYGHRSLDEHLTGRCLVRRRQPAHRCSTSLAEVMPRWLESGTGTAAGRSSPGEAAAAGISSSYRAPPHCCTLGKLQNTTEVTITSH